MRLTVCGALLLLASSLHAQDMPSHPVSGSVARPHAPRFATPDDPFALIPTGPIEQSPPPSLPGAISVRQLVVPPNAVREFQRSQKSFQAGDVRSASTHLEKAVRIYPDFFEAHNNLAGAYIDLNEYDKALAEIRQAIAINPNLEVPYNNLSSVFFSLQRYPEAEQAARHALELNPNHNPARYNLGRALAAQQHYTPEAAEALRQAIDEIPQARLPLALVLDRQGSADQAAAELREYLKAPDPAKKAAVEAWLTQLTPALAGPHPVPAENH